MNTNKIHIALTYYLHGGSNKFILFIIIQYLGLFLMFVVLNQCVKGYVYNEDYSFGIYFMHVNTSTCIVSVLRNSL